MAISSFEELSDRSPSIQRGSNGSMPMPITPISLENEARAAVRTSNEDLRASRAMSIASEARLNSSVTSLFGALIAVAAFPGVQSEKP